MKKLLLGLLTLAFIIAPITTLAASGVGQSTINSYLKVVNNYASFRSNVVVRADAIDVAIPKVTNTKLNAKYVKMNAKLDQLLTLGNTYNEQARTSLSKSTVTSADIKSVKKSLKLAKKYINKAYAQEKDLTKRLKNQKVL